MAEVSRTFVSVPAGTIHIAQAGAGKPVLLLHQTPRSWDEYRDVVPILGERFHAIAMDTIGFGDSSKPTWDGPDTIERWAEVADQPPRRAGIERASFVGHHTGAVTRSRSPPATPTASTSSSCRLRRSSTTSTGGSTATSLPSTRSSASSTALTSSSCGRCGRPSTRRASTCSSGS